MNYSAIRYHDIANGVGVRTSLFVSGCSRRCAGCFNSDAWDFGAGRAFDRGAEDELLESVADEYTNGLSVLGGEPLEGANVDGVGRLLTRFRERYGDSKDVWLWTGYRYEELDGRQREVVALADVIVDGPFVESLKDLTLRFRGSSNQRIVDVRRSTNAAHVVEWQDEEVYSTHRM